MKIVPISKGGSPTLPELYNLLPSLSNRDSYLSRTVTGLLAKRSQRRLQRFIVASRVELQDGGSRGLGCGLTIHD